MLQIDEPLVLPIGTDVSAKYKGAFCEAKIQRVTRNLKIKVTNKHNQSHTIVESEIQPEQNVKLGNWIMIKSNHFNNNQITEVMVNKVFDQSLYTVVFDDGDEATLKRTSLCLKSGKHFPASETLDQLPLTNPEHFGIPVNLGKLRSKGPANTPKKFGRHKSPKTKAQANQSDSNETDEEKIPEVIRNYRPAARVSVLGKVVCVEYGDKRGSKNKDVWFPAMIVSPTLNVSNSGVNPRAEKDEYKVRSFRDERYYNVYKKDAREFNVEQNKLFATSSECSSELRQAIEKAILYIEQKVLPENWPPPRRVSKPVEPTFLLEDTDDSIDTNDDESSSNSNLPGSSKNLRRNSKKYEDFTDESNDDDNDDDDFTDSDIQIEDDDDEDEKKEKQNRIARQEEERNLFVAQLYKFMDERGTPINHTPKVAGREMNLYKLHRIVSKMGGPSKVTKQKRWKRVYNKLFAIKKSLGTVKDNEEEGDEEDYTKSPNSPASQLKLSYKKYLLPFYELNRKLGPANLGGLPPNGTRPSRGERKREEERSRVNSTSSVSSNLSTPLISGKARKVIATSSIKAGKSTADLQTNSTLDINQPSTSTNVATSESNRGNKTPKAKSDDKRRKRKDFDSDSSETRAQNNRKDDDEDSQMTGPSSLIEGDSGDEDSSSNKKEAQISIGDGLKVKYGKGKQLKVYEAKVLKTEYDNNCSRYKYFVHYYGWSSRYDEWIYRSRIVQIIRDKSPRRRSGKVKNKGEPLPADSGISIEDEDAVDKDNKAGVRNAKNDLANSNNKSPKAAFPTESERRNRNRDEPPPKERSASLSKVKSSDDLTRGRSRTSSFSQKESTFSVRNKEKVIKTEDNAKQPPSTPTTGNKRSKIQSTPSTSKDNKETPSKAQVKRSDSDDDSSKGSTRKDKKKVSRSASELKREKRQGKEKRDIDQADLDDSIKKEDEEEGVINTITNLKKRRLDDSSSLKTTNNLQRATPSDAYEFIDDDEDEKETLPVLGKAGQSPATVQRSTKFMDLAKKDFASRNRSSTDTLESVKSDKNQTKKTETLSTSSPDEVLNKESNEPSKEQEIVLPKSPSPDLNQTPSSSAQQSSSENFLQSEFLSADSTVSLQSTGEDLEVQKILEKTEGEAPKENEADAKSEISDSHAEKPSDLSKESRTVSNKRELEDKNVSDDDIDRSPLGPLVMADEEDEEKIDSKSLSDDDNKLVVTSSTSKVYLDESNDKPSTSNQDEKSLSEATQSADSGDSNEFKADKRTESTSSVDSLLLCEETVPASPPASPPPISSQAPEPSSLHHPAASQSVQGDYFRSQMASHPSLQMDSRMPMFLNKDSSSIHSQESSAAQLAKQNYANSTPAFLANLHRNQMNSQPMNLAANAAQPFSTLIAAAVSQQQVPVNLPKSSNKGPKTLNVIVPPNIASNIMKMDTNRMRSNRDEEINDADDEAAPGMENDDDDDDNDSDCEETKRFPRKIEQSHLVGRKRRAMRSDSKVSSSNSPVAAGILSSQDSSQDGDDHSIDEELQKMVAEDINLRSKSLKSDLDLKNDDDSMSGSQSRSNRDLEMKNFKSPAPSPKKRRRGRMRNLSQSENRDISGQSFSERTKDRTLSYRPRGRHRHNTGQLNSDYSYGSTNTSPRVNNISDSNCYSSLTASNIDALLANLKPIEEIPFDYAQFRKYDYLKYKHMSPLDMKLSAEDRIRILKERLELVRKNYFEIKTKVHDIDRKKKRAVQKKKDRERKEQREQAKASAAANAALMHSGSESSSSSSKNERSSRSSSRRDNGNASGRSSARLEEANAMDTSESNLVTEDAT